jgi:uncharacterized membrane protein YhaH (DUF805 family)
VFCPNCGSKIDDGVKFCSACGTAVNTTPQQETPVVYTAASPASNFENKRLRHGFTSFWLWSTFIGQIFSLLVFLLDWLMDGELTGSSLPYSSSGDMWVIRIASAASAYASWRLIKWEKSGFWMFVGISVVLLFLNPYKLYGDNFFIAIIVYAVIIGALFGVLQFKNAFNAKSTWEQLD